MLRIYRWLAKVLLPGRFSREYGVEMERSVRARLASTPGGMRRLLLFLREVGDLVRTAAREWADELWGGPPGLRATPAGIADVTAKEVSGAVRQAFRTPGFTALAVLMIGLGVGSSTAVYGIVNVVLFTPLPFLQPEELVMIWPHVEGEERTRRHLSQPNVESLRASSFLRSLEGVNTSSAAVMGLDVAEVVPAGRVTGGLMATLGETPLMGRDLAHADAEAGAPRVVVVSHRFWQTRLDGTPEVLGATLHLFEEPYEIVGVAPPGFDYPEESLLWLPFGVSPDGCGRDCAVVERALGRLAPGVTVADATAALAALALRLSEEYPDEFAEGRGFWAESMLDHEVGDVRSGLLLTFAAVGLVLLIVCANTSVLLLTRASTRRREISLRAAFGATRRRLFSQVTAESAVLAAGGAVTGWVIATGIVAWVRVFAAELIPRVSEVTVDTSVLLALIGISALAAMCFGVYPALHIGKRARLGPLTSRSDPGGALSGPRLRGGILAGEVALCVVSLAAAGLLLRSAQELDRVDMGFDGAGVTRFTLVPPVARYPDRADLVQLISAVEGEIGQVPGVENVGSVFGAPLTTDRLGVRVSLDGAPDAETVVVYRPATAGYFATMGIPITKGRGLRSQALLEGPPEAVLNELAASVLFGDDGDPLGRSVTVNSLFGEGSMRVVGVVGDVRRNITAEPTPAIYPLYSSIEPAWRGLVVHAKVQPGFGDAVRELRSAVARVDPDLIAALPETVAEARNRETLRTQVFGGLLSGFALIAVLLAGLGLYGVVGHLVSQRTSEIGIRIALGAGRRRVAALVVRQGIGSCLAGLIVGLAVVAFGGRVLEALLFGVTPTDPSVLGGVAAVILGVACLAIWMPVRAAVRVDPVVALRAE